MRKYGLLILVFFIPLSVFAGGDPLRKFSRELGKRICLLKNPRVGILSFPYHDGRLSSGSSILSERLTTHMAGVKGLRVVERTLLEKILEEQHLSETGLVDGGAAQKIGKILDVDILITGTLIDGKGNLTELNARALIADTGEVLAASHVMVERTWVDRPRFPVDLVHEKAPAPVTPAAEDIAEASNPNEAIPLGVPASGGSTYGGSSYGNSIYRGSSSGSSTRSNSRGESSYGSSTYGGSMNKGSTFGGSNTKRGSSYGSPIRK